MSDEGYIKLYRSLLKWEWWNDTNVFRLFMYLLLAANYTDKKWQGIVVERGTVITSISKLSKATGLTIQSTRTALEKLKATNEVITKSQQGTKYTVIRVVNYDKFQGRHDNQQSINTKINEETNTKTNKVLTTTKESKEYKNINNIYISESEPEKPKKESKHKYGEYNNVLLKDTELEKLNKEYGEDKAQACIKYLDEYIEMKGAKYKSHYLVIRKWVHEAVDKQKTEKTDKPKPTKFTNFTPRESYKDMSNAELEKLVHVNNFPKKE